ncbi:peptidase s9 [Leptolyngbya sp. Heron Island J]|uniref:alpha/beta fold hydrolase n=1 Tax=Leptolyngbya sp. Heron Island J TaxID=1385935 RepID=UPI0003B9D377|nr:alpha/beta fold hydrolase [Leptolyngbya sp. Heron Island J]ESA38598.1 peptidase s9 [Leptolyngbya sp. Heron Island J]
MKQLQLGTGLIAISIGMMGFGFGNLPLPLTTNAAMAADDQLSPLIQRELFFANPEITGAQLSPDGQFLAFQKPLDGVINVWVKGINEPMEAARPVTADGDSPIIAYFWSADGRYILYAQDKGGNEDFHIYAVDPNSLGETIPTARNLTPLEGATALIYAVPKQTPNQIIVGLNDRDPRFHDIYRLDLTTGDRTLLLQNDENIGHWTTDLTGNIRLAHRQTLEKGNEILAVKDDGLIPVYSCRIEETCMPIRFHPDGQRVYLISNRDGDLIQLELLDLESQQSQVIEADPENQVDFATAIFSEATDELVATAYVGDRLRIYPQEEQFAADLAFIQQQLPEMELSVQSMTQDDRLVLISAQSDVNPGAVYLFDSSAQTLEKLYEVRPELSNQQLATMQPVRYTARDGLEIPAYLTLPQGLDPVNLPAIVMPHGGPWARDVWGYHPFTQFLANRGYAVLQPNFRGSTGYGKAFLNAGNNEWGTGAMQHDLTDGVQYLIDAGIADPERVGIFGGSYGGYATLAGLAFTPDIYAVGVSAVGPSNLITLLESIPPYWAALHATFALRLGDLEDESDRNRLQAQSPLFAAEQIQAPLMVIQGANDPRVKQAESDQIVAALRDLDRPVEYLVALDEGHGFRKEINTLAMTAALERFLAEHLGGRYQPEMTPDLQTQLDALTVDINTVTVTESSQPEIVELDPAIYDRYTGTYQLMPNMQIAISVNEEQLIAQATGQEAFNLYPISETQFVAKIADILIQFQAAPEETVSGLTLYQAGQELFAPKVSGE